MASEISFRLRWALVGKQAMDVFKDVIEVTLAKLSKHDIECTHNRFLCEVKIWNFRTLLSNADFKSKH